MERKIPSLVAILLALALNAAARQQPAGPQLAAAEIEIRNRGLSARIGVADGAIRSVTNLLTGEQHQVKAGPVEFETSAGRIAASRAIRAEQIPGGAMFAYEAAGTDIKVSYHVEPERDYLRKTVEITNRGTGPLTISEVSPEAIRFLPNFTAIHRHRDPSQYAWLINLFLRDRKGGFYMGIENPFWNELDEGSGNAMGSSWIRMSYRPAVLLRPGESYESDASFLGSYRSEGVYAFKELGKLKRAVSDPTAVASDRSYLAPAHNQTTLDFTQEVLDWGEVWALQDFLRALQPPYDSKRPGYYVRAVAMVGGRRTAAMGSETGFHIAFGPEHVAGSKGFVDDIARLGHIPHIEWATEWFGVGGYANPTPGLRLENAGPDEPAPVNPYWQEVVRYGWEKIIDTGLFETVTRDFARNKMEWKVLNHDGTLWLKAAGNPPQHVNCWANRDYVKWRLQMTDQAVRDYRLYMIGWDSSYPACWTWLGWPNNKTECWATNHGHPPGDIRYAIFRNMLWFLDQLHARHPQLALRVAAGTIMDFPWVVKDLIEYHPSFFDGETGGSFWLNTTFRFIPMYKSGVLLSATVDSSFRYLLLRSISASDHFMMFPDAVPVALNNKAFWDKWLGWADEHIAYLRAGRALFREMWGDDFIASLPPALEGRLPAPAPQIHGSAHCVKDRGYLFLFNPAKETRIGVIPINHWLGLTEGKRFGVSELFPAEGKSHGVYDRGEEMKVAIQARTAMVLEIGPAEGLTKASRHAMPAKAAVDKAFLKWNEIPWREIMPQ